jgi:hypothetical protein
MAAIRRSDAKGSAHFFRPEAREGLASSATLRGRHEDHEHRHGLEGEIAPRDRRPCRPDRRGLHAGGGTRAPRGAGGCDRLRLLGLQARSRPERARRGRRGRGDDPDPRIRGAITSAFPAVRGFPDLASALPHVDAAVVATPPRNHAEVALQALRDGKHVLVEKPITTALVDARLLAAEARRAGVILMAGHTFELIPPCANCAGAWTRASSARSITSTPPA